MSRIIFPLENSSAWERLTFVEMGGSVPMSVKLQ